MYKWIAAVMLLIIILPIGGGLYWSQKNRITAIGHAAVVWHWYILTCMWLWKLMPKQLKDSRLFSGQVIRLSGQLHPGINKKKVLYVYQIRQMMIVYGTVCLAVLTAVGGLWAKNVAAHITTVERMDVRGEEKTVCLEAEFDRDDAMYEIDFQLHQQQYTKKERERLFQSVKTYLDQHILGGNPSFEEISEDLVFPEEYSGENVKIEWQPEDYSLVHQDGTLGELSLYELPLTTNIRAVISYEQYSDIYEKELTIVQAEKSSYEKKMDALRQAVNQADADSKESKELVLPEILDGEKIVWTEKKTESCAYLVVLIMIASICLLLYQDQHYERQCRQRQLQLSSAYPGFVHQMVLLLEAGMTVRRSWEQILYNYEVKEDLKEKEYYLYQELRYTLFKMQTGMTEIQAYTLFGERTGLSEYHHFVQLLIQYMRKGSRGMQEMMMQEVCDAQRQRRDMARQLGETAGTKLLGPMILLLIVVLGVVIAPAWLSM